MHLLGLPFSTVLLHSLLLRFLLALQAFTIFLFEVLDPALIHMM